MSIATEITRLQNIKADIRSALVTKGVPASSHNMADFPEDILSISGGSEVVAFIVVTYPAGSTCTCSNGSVTLTATDSSGSFAFGVPSVGSWIITATLGDDTATETVNITTIGQSESVELSYRVPSEYQAVEYLQTTRTTYIELDTKTNEINKIYAKCQQIDTADSYTVVMALAPQRYYPLMLIGTSEIGGIFGNTWSRANGQVTSAINEVIVDCPVGGNYGLTINGVRQSVGGIVTNCAVNLMVFGGNKTDWNRIGRLYKIEFYNDDTLVANLFPCYRKSDNVAGLWDNVNEKFYTNMGTGSFVVGGDI